MASHVHVSIVDQSGDVGFERVKQSFLSRSYAYFQSGTMGVDASTLTDIDFPFSDIDFIYIESETSTATCRVYKDGESTYWEFTKAVLIFDTDASLLQVWADAAATLRFVIGGS